MSSESKPRAARRRVALLFDAIEDDYQAGVVRGAAHASLHADVELICVAGGVVGEAQKDARSARNFLFDLIEPQTLDGVLALGSSLSDQVGVEAFAEWMQRFRGVPTVSLGAKLAGLHSITIDGAPGMRETLRHLIGLHQHRRIAFIRGPVTSYDAEQRYAVYRAVLSEAGIAEDPRLVLSGTWFRESGAAAVHELFDVRGVKVDAVGAIAVSSDLVALGVMEALRERGIAVPGDIAVTGFDDIDAAHCAVPPLTTVRQPTEALGSEGLQRLLAVMDGLEQPRETTLAATTVGRRSCGCSRTDVLMRGPSSVRPGRSFEVAVLERRALICAELSRSARGTLLGAGAGWEQRLLSALLDDLRDRQAGAFSTALDQLMAGIQRAGGDLNLAQTVLSTLRHALLDCAGEDQHALLRIADEFDPARELISEWLVRGETLRRLQAGDFMRELSQVPGLLLRAPGTSPTGNREALETRLARLGIASLSLGLFTEPGKVTKTCLCLAGYGPGGRVSVQSHFRSSDFSAKDVFADERRALLVQPLLYEDAPMGLLTLALGELHGGVYEQVREVLGVGLRGYRLANQLG